MWVAGALAQMRALAEARMLDTFDIATPLGARWDDVTGRDVEDYEPLFSTPGRVKVSGGLAARESEAGARTVTTVSRELHIPVDSPAIPAGAVAVCTAVHATSDPTLLGAALVIEGPSPGSQTTARRLEVSEVIQ